MGKNTRIPWTTHTFNPWWGCTKIAAGCVHCYAADTARRFGYDCWGPDKLRRMMSDKYWKAPLGWNTTAKRKNAVTTVFAGSMCDVFELHPSGGTFNLFIAVARKRLWTLIADTPYLTWLLLTKRPRNIMEMLPENPPSNIWLGGSVATQQELPGICLALEQARERFELPYFLSVEPMIESVRLGPFRPNWVIIGGESGPKARTFKKDWALDLIYLDCAEREIPVFFKQIGSAVARSAGLSDQKGADPAEWDPYLRVQQFPWFRAGIWPK